MIKKLNTNYARVCAKINVDKVLCVVKNMYEMFGS
jgi:hypothetical protein